MTLIRPSFVENLYNTFYSLEPDRMMYYLYVVRLSRSIFLSLGFANKVNQMNQIIREEIELPLNCDFVSLIHAFYNPRFLHSKSAYTKIGDHLDYKEVTRYEIMQRLEKVKDWIYDEVTKLTPYIRFTKGSMVMT